MRVDPQLAQARRDPRPLQYAQAAVEAARERWAGTAAAVPLAELARFGGGAPLAACPALAAIVTDPCAARRLLDPLIGPMLAALAAHPLAQVPLRHQYSPGLGVVQLAASGRAALSLVVYEAVTRRPARAQTVCFAGGERHELCLAGAAAARFFEIADQRDDGAELTCSPRWLSEGDTVALAGGAAAKIVDDPDGRLVVLRLSRTDDDPVPAREYRIADGAMVHCASGDGEESRAEMAMAVLGAMGRADAVPTMLARGAGASVHLRWQALRHALALDSGTGFAALCTAARAADDPLSGPAAQLRAQLLAQHPVLAGWEAVPCPA